MKKLNLLGCLILLTMVLFTTSCEKEDTVDIINTETDTVLPDRIFVQNPLFNRSGASEEGLDLDCFEILYPFSVVDNDGIEYEITRIEDFESILSEIEGNEIIDFVYPINVLTDDGGFAVADAFGLGELFALCVPDGGWNEDDFPAYLIDNTNSCYTLDYPISVEDLNGNVEVAENETEFVGLISEEDLFFVFPFGLIDEDGTALEITNVDALFNTLFDCNFIDQDSLWDWEVGFEFIGCYRVEFPLIVVTEDGEVEVNNHMELCDLMLEGQLIGYGFPLTLLDEEGDEIVVNSEEEFNEAIAACNIVGGENPEELFLLLAGAIGNDQNGTNACYTIQFPIIVNINDSDGNTETQSINSLTEAIELSQGEFQLIELEYPINVSLANGEEVTFESGSDIFEVLNSCE